MDVCYLDLNRAFDLVNRRVLIQNAQFFGIVGPVLNRVRKFQRSPGHSVSVL